MKLFMKVMFCMLKTKISLSTTGVFPCFFSLLVPFLPFLFCNNHNVGSSKNLRNLFKLVLQCSNYGFMEVSWNYWFGGADWLSWLLLLFTRNLTALFLVCHFSLVCNFQFNANWASGISFWMVSFFLVSCLLLVFFFLHFFLFSLPTISQLMFWMQLLYSYNIHVGCLLQVNHGCSYFLLHCKLWTLLEIGL